MKIIIIHIGTTQLSFAKDGIVEYFKRTKRFADVEIITVKETSKSEEKIIQLSEGYFRVLLDEQGKSYSSKEFANFLENKQNHSQSLAFIIGGPNGHTSRIREHADTFFALSHLTFPHDLALLFFTETLYRSLSIINKHPYHRE
jgi:23S rRNA (pseudouridine1915-N3)-methyltransferase